MLHPELPYRLALTQIPHIGPVQAKILLQHCNAEEIFHAKKSFLEKIEGIGPVRAAAIAAFRDFSRVEQEIEYVQKNNIRPLFITDEGYPKRLLHCHDAPVVLFYKGSADLNAGKIVSVIGTRNPSAYGKKVTGELISGFSGKNITIVSGLALGVDALAHKTALSCQLPTIAVLAHGLDQLYPAEHRQLAFEMLQGNGGLLTEYFSGTKPDKHLFPNRNRIVAGMSDASIVVETGLRGGSMITAELANGYNKDVFAIPGRVHDERSKGCHELIRKNKAILLTEARELIELMNWDEIRDRKQTKKRQRELFIELSETEKAILALFHEKEQLHIDEIHLNSGLNSSAVAAALLNLEIQNIISVLPGKCFSLL